MLLSHCLCVALLAPAICAASQPFKLKVLGTNRSGYFMSLNWGNWVIYEFQDPEEDAQCIIQDDLTLTVGDLATGIDENLKLVSEAGENPTSPFTIKDGILQLNGSDFYSDAGYRDDDLYYIGLSGDAIQLQAILLNGEIAPDFPYHSSLTFSSEISSSETSSEHSTSDTSIVGYSIQTSSEDSSESINVETSSKESTSTTTSSPDTLNITPVGTESSNAAASLSEVSGSGSGTAQTCSVFSSSAKTGTNEMGPSSDSDSMNTGSSIVTMSTNSVRSLITATSESTTSESTTSGTTSFPTAPALRNPAKLMGADLITDISLHDNSTGSSYANPHDFFTINVTVESQKPIGKGTKVQFGVPEVFYGNITPFDIYSNDGELVGTVSSSEVNVFTITFDGDYGLSHTNVKGTFTFNIKLRYVHHGKRDLPSLDFTHELVQPFVFTTVSRDFVSSLIFDDLTSGVDAGDAKPGNIFVFTGDSFVSLVNSSTSPATPSGSSSESTEIGSVPTWVPGSGSNDTGSGAGESADTKTVTDVLATIVTITSCSDHKCHETTVPATWGPATTTLDDGVMTVYTTWCPETSAETKGKTTTTITMTSCSNGKCHGTTVPATWGPATTTLEGGEETVYITWCPVTVTSTTVYQTVVCTDNVCKTSSVTGVLSPGLSTLETVGTSAAGIATPGVSAPFNGAAQIRGYSLALVAIPLAYFL